MLNYKDIEFFLKKFRFYKISRLLILDEIDSTNSYILRSNNFNLRGNVVVFSRKQDNGRGRYLNKWCSVGGSSLLMSLCVNNFVYVNCTNIYYLGLFVGLAVFKVLHFLKLGCLVFKWPNDIYLKKFKITGILIDKYDDRNFVLGIGVNIKDFNFFHENFKGVESYISDEFKCKSLVSLIGVMCIFNIINILEFFFIKNKKIQFFLKSIFSLYF
ncbi:MAG: biotin--[acetyl-CoA-carboxylase] ligase [Enterobacteriaceae bacterium]|nr:biotin--[acetyl-CoA-carboxylase] ligase [Enterobacteriaceae bacterium]